MKRWFCYRLIMTEGKVNAAFTKNCVKDNCAKGNYFPMLLIPEKQLKKKVKKKFWGS